MQSDPLAYESDSTLGRLRKLTQASSAIAAVHTLDILPKVIAEQAKNLTNAHLCVVIIHMENTPGLVAVACSADYTSWQNHTDLLGALGSTVTRPVRLTQAELETQPAWHNLLEQVGSWHPICGWLAVPI